MSKLLAFGLSCRKNARPRETAEQITKSESFARPFPEKEIHISTGEDAIALGGCIRNIVAPAKLAGYKPFGFGGGVP
jgi:hypothetical protein